MNNLDRNIGKLMYIQRKKLKLSQQDVANVLFCVRSNISHYENGSRSIPHEYLLPLSKVLKFNFIQYVENSHKYKTTEHYQLAYEMIDYTVNFSYEKLEELLSNEVIINEFNYGSAFILREYSRAQVATYIYNDYESAETILLNILNVGSRYELVNFEPILCVEERYYSCIVHLGSILCMRGHIDLSEKLFKKTITFIEYYYTNNNIPTQSINTNFRKIHVALLNNYADVLLRQNRLDEALVSCNNALNHLIKYETTYILELVLKLKIEILYKLGDIEECQELFNDFKSICKLKSNIEYLNNVNVQFNVICPLIKL